MRIGLIGLHLETAADNPLPSTRAAFRVYSGERLLKELEADAVRVGLGDATPELVPIWYAKARPGGRLARDDAATMLTELRAALRTVTPLDGLLLFQHGGLRLSGPEPPGRDEVERVSRLTVANRDGEAAVVHACRSIVGAHTPMVAVFDPHGDPGDEALTALDGACAFRTAPHVDVVSTRRRALRLLRSVVRGGLRPVVRIERGSLVLPGAVAEGPGAGEEAFESAAHVQRLPGILDASWMPASPWTDMPPGRSGFMVVADGEATARRAAKDAVAFVEGKRNRFRFGGGLVDVGDAARWSSHAAPTSPTRATVATGVPSLMLDSGDAIGAGGVGDRWDVAFAFVDAGAPDGLVAGVVAPGLAERCRTAGDGGSFVATVRAELAPSSAEVRRLEVRVERASIELGPDEEGGPPPDWDPAILISIAGVNVLLLTARREISSWSMLERALGPLRRWRCMVVKTSRPPADTPPASRLWRLASPGATDHRVGVGAR